MIKETGLNTGTIISHYRIVSKIGAGGMGEVYRAKDTKLNRDVAIKVLPEAFAQDEERVSRFKREAQVLAALNHPNIASIYGLEETNGILGLVMELVEGPTLADRIAADSIPLHEALAISKQIAEALESAHERGIIHRDLKPANVKVTDAGGVKVLDFGLAKIFSDDAPDTDLSHSPTLIKGTQSGMILGTAAYMSPEQAKGKAVDKRSDIWAFGCVLFEMLSAKQTFGGETLTDTLAAVVRDEPEWDALPLATPHAVRTLLKRCLEKDPKHRLRDIGDARFDLTERQDPSSIPPPQGSRAKTMRLISLSLAGALIGALVTWLAVRAPTPSPRPVKRFAVSGLSPLVIDPFQALALSPDGSLLAFRGRGLDELERIFVRKLETLELKVLADTDGARLPFFSADSQSIGFFAGGSLRKIAVAGGPAQTIATATTGPTGGTWMDDGSIVFIGDPELGVQRISSSGGTPETILAFDRKNGETAAATPWGLPGSQGVLLSVRRGDRFDVGVLSLRDRKLHIIAEDGYSAAWVPTGHVLFHQGNAILALPFDAERLEATGPAFPVLSGLSNRMSYQTKLFAVAQDGTLVYLPQAPPGEAQWALCWVDRKGQEIPVTRLERPSDTPRLSPDGTRVAFRTPAANCDVWSYDLARGTTTRLTQKGDNHGVAWTPDGTRVTVGRELLDSADLVSVSADGSGSDQRIASFPANSGPLPSSWSSIAGALLVEYRFSPQTGYDISVLPAGGEPKALINSAFDEKAAVFSPDGRFVAYASNESGRTEVYVRWYSGQGPRTQVSAEGGVEPVWSRDGKELFFRHGRDLLAVTVQTTPAFSAGRPQIVFSGDYAFGPQLANYDVAPDGKRFLMMKGRQWVEGQLVVVLNWFTDWKHQE